jgi:hypothetical protein
MPVIQTLRGGDHALFKGNRNMLPQFSKLAIFLEILGGSVTRLRDSSDSTVEDSVGKSLECGLVVRRWIHRDVDASAQKYQKPGFSGFL